MGSSEGSGHWMLVVACRYPTKAAVPAVAVKMVFRIMPMVYGLFH